MSYKQRLDPSTRASYYEHRAMAEWKLGRALHPQEVVQHVNGDPRDNHPQNIWVFSLQRAHMLYHHHCWRMQRGVIRLFSFEEMLQVHGEGWWR